WSSSAWILLRIHRASWSCDQRSRVYDVRAAEESRAGQPGLPAQSADLPVGGQVAVAFRGSAATSGRARMPAPRRVLRLSLHGTGRRRVRDDAFPVTVDLERSHR